MLSPVEIENFYREYSNNIANFAHDGILNVNLNLLYELDLLQDIPSPNDDPDDITQYFHVMENPEKVTLFNEQFLIWIVPKAENDLPVTYVMIALCNNSKTSLEIVFTTSGVYNTPKFVLKVLQSFLIDMIETEATLTAIEKNEP
jgi:hypothetical protein